MIQTTEQKMHYFIDGFSSSKAGPNHARQVWISIKRNGIMSYSSDTCECCLHDGCFVKFALSLKIGYSVYGSISAKRNTLFKYLVRVTSRHVTSRYRRCDCDYHIDWAIVSSSSALNIKYCIEHQGFIVRSKDTNIWQLGSFFFFVNILRFWKFFFTNDFFRRRNKRNMCSNGMIMMMMTEKNVKDFVFWRGGL